MQASVKTGGMSVTDGEIYITRLSAWALGIKGDAQWKEWASGSLEMLHGSQAPEIAFTDPMLRRRLSQITKMTIQVVSDLQPLGDDTKMIFVSFRGELARQYKINRMQIKDGALMPAGFSLSVFNTPPALACIALGLKGGYSALYPGGNYLSAGLGAARAALCSGSAEEIIFVYADEELPPEYSCLLPSSPPPLAFGLLLGRKPGPVPLRPNEADDSPAGFLKSLILCKGMYVSP